jgi:hypothetical protein
MYNLFVSSNMDAWEGEPFQTEMYRCVREYTATEITDRFGGLDEAAIAELKKLPCIFAYETGCQKPPKFGSITDVTVRAEQGLVRIEYDINEVVPFLSNEDMLLLSFELDIGKWEMNRTHWAVKEVNLAKELRRSRSILLPDWVGTNLRAVDITTHNFKVALSFPGETRPLIEPVAMELERALGPHSYFYDSNYTSQLARPGLDLLLQDIYGARSKLIVIFLSADYQRKLWCGVEFRAIRQILMRQDNRKIMYVRMDDGSVDGVFDTDGYIDGRRHSPQAIAGFIVERVGLLP